MIQITPHSDLPDNSLVSATAEQAAAHAKNGTSNHSNLPENIASHSSDSELYFDILDLLRGEKKGHMSKYAYQEGNSKNDPAGGIQHWSKLVENPDFPSNREKLLFENKKILETVPEALPRQLRRISLVEIGPGLVSSVQQKSCKLLDAFKRRANDIRFTDYTAVDISPKFAHDAIELASKRFKKTYAVCEDYTKMPPLKSLGGTPFAMIWGGTLWNTHSVNGVLSDHMLANHLALIGNSLVTESKPEAYIAFTYFGQRTADAWKKTYEDPNNIKTVESILHVMSRHERVKLDPKNFQIKIDYNEKERLLTMAAESTKKQEINIVGLGPAHLKQGQQLVLVNAYRPTAEDIENIAKKAGCTVLTQSYDKASDVGIFVVKYGQGPT